MFKKPIKSCTACVAWDITGPSAQPMHFTTHLNRRIEVSQTIQIVLLPQTSFIGPLFQKLH